MKDEDQYDEFETDTPELLGQKEWSRRAQRIASILWPSFGAAAVGAVMCFTFIDPELLGMALMPEREISALTGYGICFFFFWFIALLSSYTTMFLRRTSRRQIDTRHLDDDRPVRDSEE
jgi:hypothetical protein